MSEAYILIQAQGARNRKAIAEAVGTMKGVLRAEVVYGYVRDVPYDVLARVSAELEELLMAIYRTEGVKAVHVLRVDAEAKGKLAPPPPPAHADPGVKMPRSW